MRILITGATGFLGSHLTKALINEDYEIAILKRSYSNTWRISGILKDVKTFNIDTCSIDEPFKECGQFDVVIHTATEYGRSGEAFSQLLQSNVSFPLKLLETAISYKTKLFINTDSFIHKSNYSFQHLAGYAITKQQFLQWIKVYSHLEKIKLVNLKLEHVYGPFDTEGKFIPFVLENCLKNVPELNLTLGNQKRDFIHISDVISAYSTIISRNIEAFQYFQEYGVGSGSSLSIRQLVELIHEKTKSNTLLRFGAIPYQKNEVMESKANNYELKKLGWKNQISLEEGICLTLAANEHRK